MVVIEVIVVFSVWPCLAPFAATANPRHIHKVGWVYEEDGIYYAHVGEETATVLTMDRLMHA